MADFYNLSYTAEEINQKLGIVPENGTWAGIFESDPQIIPTIKDKLNYLTPDQFEGADSNKLSQCFEALENSGGVILIEREMKLYSDVVIKHNSNLNNRIFVKGIGKNASINTQGFSFVSGVFDAEGKPKRQGGIVFENINFSGTNTLIDGGTLIRVSFNSCAFDGFESIVSATNTYIQSIYITNCLIRNTSDYIISIIHNSAKPLSVNTVQELMLYDAKVVNNIIEWGGGVASCNSAQGCVFAHNCIEGMTKALFRFPLVINQVTIDGNYFEANEYPIKDIDELEELAKQGQLSDDDSNGTYHVYEDKTSDGKVYYIHKVIVPLIDIGDGMQYTAQSITISNNNFICKVYSNAPENKRPFLIKLPKVVNKGKIVITGNNFKTHSTATFVLSESTIPLTNVIYMGNDGNLVDPNNTVKVIDDIELSVVTPKMFGAVGDGDTDDTIAVQSAVNYAIAKNLPLLLTDTYKVKTIDITNKYSCGLKIIGASNSAQKKAKIIVSGNSSRGLDISGTEKLIFDNVCIVGDEKAPPKCLLYASRTTENNQTNGHTFYNCYFGGCTAVANIYNYAGEMWKFYNTKIVVSDGSKALYGFYGTSVNTQSIVSNDITIANNQTSPLTCTSFRDCSFSIRGGISLDEDGNQITGRGAISVYFESDKIQSGIDHMVSNIVFDNCYAYNETNTSFSFKDVSGNIAFYNLVDESGATNNEHRDPPFIHCTGENTLKSLLFSNTMIYGKQNTPALRVDCPIYGYNNINSRSFNGPVWVFNDISRQLRHNLSMGEKFLASKCRDVLVESEDGSPLPLAPRKYDPLSGATFPSAELINKILGDTDYLASNTLFIFDADYKPRLMNGQYLEIEGSPSGKYCATPTSRVYDSTNNIHYLGTGWSLEDWLPIEASGTSGGFVASDTNPTNTNVLWIDTNTDGGLKYHNGTDWVTVPVRFS